MMRKLTLLGTLATLLLVLAPAGASATTFDGSCTMKGTIYPLKPYKFVPENNDAEVFGSGTCMGTLDGAAYNGPAHIYVDGRMDSPMSCGLLLAQNVPGVITFGPDPRAVDATLLDIRAAQGWELLGHMTGHVNGAYNGESLLQLELAAGEPEVRACGADGLKSVNFDLELQTFKELYG